jgi:hypothetical protein
LQVRQLVGGESLFPAEAPQDRREGLETFVIERVEVGLVGCEISITLRRTGNAMLIEVGVQGLFLPSLEGSSLGRTRLLLFPSNSLKRASGRLPPSAQRCSAELPGSPLADRVAPRPGRTLNGFARHPIGAACAGTVSISSPSQAKPPLAGIAALSGSHISSVRLCQRYLDSYIA